MLRYILLFITVFISACYDDYDFSEEIIIEEEPGTLVNTYVNGIIHIDGFEDYEKLDLQIGPLFQGLKSNQFYEYAEGLRKEAQLLELYYNNQLLAISRFRPVENDINKLAIQPLPVLEEYSISSGTINENISLGDQFTLELRGVPVDNSGIAYNGDYKVEFAQLNSDFFFATFGYSARSVTNEKLIIDAYKSGMYMRVLGSRGEELSFAPGMASLRYMTGEGVQLFSIFQDGRLQAISNQASIVKSGFNFLLGAQPASDISITLDFDGKAVAYSQLRINGRSFEGTAKGKYSIVVEDGVDLDIELIDRCGNSIKNWLISANDISDENLHLSLEASESSYVFVFQADMIDCNGTKASISALSLDETGTDRTLIYPEFTNSIVTTICSESFKIAGLDVSDWTTGPEFDWRTEFGSDMGHILNCNLDTDAYGFFSISDELKLYESFELELHDSETIIRSSDDVFRIRFDGVSEGSYLTEGVNLYIDDPGFGDKGIRIYCENSELGCGVEHFEVSHYPMGSVENLFRVTLDGRIWAQTLNPPVAGYYPLEGTIFIRTN